MYRLFVAIDIPEDVKDELASFCYGIPGARWVSIDQFHLTLHFIGEVDGGAYNDIVSSLTELTNTIIAEPKSAELQLQLSGLGFFPPRKIPKVLWVGVEKNEALMLLRNRIGAALRRAGVQLEKRKFSPHITLARLRNSPRDKVAGFLAGHNLYKSKKFAVTDFKLYSSVLTRKGAAHTVEKVFQLVGVIP